MLENTSDECFKADHIIWLLVEDADGPGCELCINGYKKKKHLMNWSPLYAVNLSYMCIRDAFYRDTCSYSRRLLLLYLYYTICKHSENVYMKMMANLLTVSLEWVLISKRLYIRMCIYDIFFLCASPHGITQQKLLIFGDFKRSAKKLCSRIFLGLIRVTEGIFSAEL